MAKVAVEKEGPITVVAIDRFAEARNAVDPETAVLLRDAFLAFDADASQSVAILTGARRDVLRRLRPQGRRQAKVGRASLMPKPRARWARRAICCPSR